MNLFHSYIYMQKPLEFRPRVICLFHTCKRIGYEFYCKELFVVRHKSIHSCKSTIYFDVDTEIIKQNCDLIFYYNKSDI